MSQFATIRKLWRDSVPIGTGRASAKAFGYLSQDPGASRSLSLGCIGAIMFENFWDSHACSAVRNMCAGRVCVDAASMAFLFFRACDTEIEPRTSSGFQNLEHSSLVEQSGAEPAPSLLPNVLWPRSLLESQRGALPKPVNALSSAVTWTARLGVTFIPCDDSVTRCFRDGPLHQAGGWISKATHKAPEDGLC